MIFSPVGSSQCHRDGMEKDEGREGAYYMDRAFAGVRCVGREEKKGNIPQMTNFHQNMLYPVVKSMFQMLGMDSIGSDL